MLYEVITRKGSALPARHVGLGPQSLEVCQLADRARRIRTSAFIVWIDEQCASPRIECGLQVFVAEMGAALFDQDIHLGSQLASDVGQVSTRARVARIGVQGLKLVADRRVGILRGECVS